MEPIVDVLIPTFRRPGALAVTLAALIGQSLADFRVVVSDQSDGPLAIDAPEVRAAVRVLEATGREVSLLAHPVRRGMAEQRQFLLDRSRAPYALFIDDDVVLEPWVLDRLLAVIQRERCGFTGCGLIGLSHAADVRPDEQHIEFWDGPVRPETVTPRSPAWQRYRLHNAANLLHVQQMLGVTPEHVRAYRVAWIGGCVLYDTEKLRDVGGFGFWRDLPEHHAGEDVVAQLRVMARYGGCGILPSGAYHQELPTTLEIRQVDAPHVVPADPSVGVG